MLGWRRVVGVLLLQLAVCASAVELSLVRRIECNNYWR